MLCSIITRCADVSERSSIRRKDSSRNFSSPSCRRVMFSGMVIAAAEDSRRTLEIERSEEHTSELQSLMRITYAGFCLKKKRKITLRNYSHIAHQVLRIIIEKKVQ